MTKPFYAEYANHAMRFYARHSDVRPGPERKNDLLMWDSCAAAIGKLNKEEAAIILAVYRSKCTIREAVTCASRELNMPENKIWQLVNRCGKMFAKERGLI